MVSSSAFQPTFAELGGWSFVVGSVFFLIKCLQDEEVIHPSWDFATLKPFSMGSLLYLIGSLFFTWDAHMSGREVRKERGGEYTSNSCPAICGASCRRDGQLEERVSSEGSRGLDHRVVDGVHGTVLPRSAAPETTKRTVVLGEEVIGFGEVYGGRTRPE